LFLQIDAFTAQAFGGNPAAVVLLPRTALPLADATRQAVAAEKNLSETAFLECADGDSDQFAACTRFRLRWFTPAIEVPLCGHATLASAAAIFFGEGNPASQLAFDTLSGELRVTRQQAGAAANGTSTTTTSSGSADMLSMDLPLIEASADEVPAGCGPGSALVQVSSCRGDAGWAS
jgi:PhzF family phenazine biosynthesis protein